MEIDSIEEGFYYHIYNRGNNGEKIFYSVENYHYFLKLLAKYMLPVLDLYAYCLLENHFHFLVRIKEKEDINHKELKYSTIQKPKIVSASKQFSHFLNAYSQAINKKYNRTGSLFEKPFERKRITNDQYLKQVVLYINTNPVNHRLVSKPEDYVWSSYKTLISDGKTKLKRKETLDLFENRENFIWCHENYESLQTIY